MDDHLRELIQDLGNVINESLSDSERLGEAIEDIRKSGYDVFLVVEATVGFNKRDQGEAMDTTDAVSRLPTELTFTAQDQAFLKSLKINIEEQ